MQKEKDQAIVVAMPGQTDPVHLSESGKIPALRVSLQEKLGHAYSRMKVASEKLTQLADAQAALLETAVRQAEQALQELQNDLQDRGV